MSDVKELVHRWAKTIGKDQAEGRLRAAGISSTVAWQLCAGKYLSEPSKWTRPAILEELAKDGFTLSEDAS